MRVVKQLHFINAAFINRKKHFFYFIQVCHLSNFQIISKPYQVLCLGQLRTPNFQKRFFIGIYDTPYKDMERLPL